LGEGGGEGHAEADDGMSPPALIAAPNATPRVVLTCVDPILFYKPSLQSVLFSKYLPVENSSHQQKRSEPTTWSVPEV
jgi:hypothetical protein